MSYDPLCDSAVNASTPDAQSYWQATHTPARYPSLSGDTDTDYVVIGGGYTGLSAALTLADAGQAVTLIDARHSGFGCAGRNAGFVLNGTGRLSVPAIADKWGDDIARGMAGEFKAAVSTLKSRVERYAIDCDLMAGDYYKIAHNAKQARLQEKQAAHSGLDYLSAATLNQRFGMDGAYGAQVQPGLTLNPLKYADGLARVAADKGAALHSNTPALSLDTSGKGVEVATPNATIHANKALIATNAYSPKSFSPLIDNRQFPVQSSIIVTAPLNDQQKAETGLDMPVSMMDTRMMKYYYRTLPDGRVLFGGRGAVKGKDAHKPEEKARMVNALCDVFPALAGIDIDYFWSGWVSVALDSLPRIFVDEDTRVGYAMGYCGSGVSFAGFAGMRLAERMMGGEAAAHIDTTLPLYNAPLPRYPFASLRRLGLRALYNWARVAE